MSFRVRRRIGLSFLSLVMAACGATAHTPVAPTASPSRSVQPRTLSLSTEPATGALLPTLGPLVLVSDRGDERSYLYGALRLRVVGREATLGTEPFAAPISAATRTESGWVFVSADGVVASSESFTGPLRRLGQTPIFAPRGARASRGRAVVADGMGTLWSTDGTGDLAALTALAGRHIESAAFVNALSGAALVRGGELVFTADGGGTWQPIALGGATATSVLFVSDAMVVETSAGSRRIAVDGTLTPAAAAAVETPRPAAGDAARALDAIVSAYPDMLANFEAVRRDDGAAVLIDRDALVVLGSANGRIRRRLTGISLRGCSLSSWGPEIAIYCSAASDDEDPRAYRLNDDEAVPVEIPWNARDAVFSDDARHAARPHACRGETGTASSICVLRDGLREWRTVTTTAPLERLTAMQGTSVLAMTTDHHIVLVDTETGATTSPTLQSDRTDLTPVFISFTRDGGFAGSADDAEHGHYTLLGRSINELRATPMPRGAIVCGFVDQLHGAAAGRTAGQLWRTLDGGRNWERVELGIDGVTREVPLLPRPDAIYGSIACTELGCTIGRAASIRGWGTLAAPAHHVLGPNPAPQPVESPAPVAAVIATTPEPAPASRRRRHGQHRSHPASAHPAGSARPSHHGSHRSHQSGRHHRSGH